MTGSRRRIPPAPDAVAIPPTNPGETLFRNHLEVVEWAIRFVCQKHGLSAEETEDFSSHVRLKLMDDDYAALRKFRGESKLSTFLVATILSVSGLPECALGKVAPVSKSRAAGRRGAVD